MGNLGTGVSFHLLHHVFDVKFELRLSLRQVLVFAQHRLLLVDVTLNLRPLLTNVFVDALLQINPTCSQVTHTSGSVT